MGKDKVKWYLLTSDLLKIADPGNQQWVRKVQGPNLKKLVTHGHFQINLLPKKWLLASLTTVIIVAITHTTDQRVGSMLSKKVLKLNYL